MKNYATQVQSVNFSTFAISLAGLIPQIVKLTVSCTWNRTLMRPEASVAKVLKLTVLYTEC